jgi:hypothetical protein
VAGDTAVPGAPYLTLMPGVIGPKNTILLAKHYTLRQQQSSISHSGTTPLKAQQSRHLYCLYRETIDSWQNPL